MVLISVTSSVSIIFYNLMRQAFIVSAFRPSNLLPEWPIKVCYHIQEHFSLMVQTFTHSSHKQGLKA